MERPTAGGRCGSSAVPNRRLETGWSAASPSNLTVDERGGEWRRRIVGVVRVVYIGE